jgi:hypothetical protein
MSNNHVGCSGQYPAIHRATAADYPYLVSLHRELCQNELNHDYADRLEIDWLASAEGAEYFRAILDGAGLGLLAHAAGTPKPIG